MATDAGSQHLGVVDNRRWQPRHSVVAVHAIITGGNVIDRLARAAGGTVAAHARRGSRSAVIEAARATERAAAHCRQSDRCVRTQNGGSRTSDRVPILCIVAILAIVGCRTLTGMIVVYHPNPKRHAGLCLPSHTALVATLTQHRGHEGMLHDRAGEGREITHGVATFARDIERAAIRWVSRNVARCSRRRRHRPCGPIRPQARENLSIRVTGLTAVGNAGMSCCAHHRNRKVPRRRVAHRAPESSWDVVGRLHTASDRRRKCRCRRVAATAIARGRMSLVEGLRSGITAGRCSTGNHARVGGRLVAGGASRHLTLHRRVSRDSKRRRIDIRYTKLEATRIDIGGRVTPRSVAVQGSKRKVIGRGRSDHGDVGKRSDGRTMASQAIGHALVRAHHRIQRVVARRRMALRTGCRRRNMVRRLGSCA